MAIELRALADDEIEQAEFIRAYSFNATDRGDLPATVERVRRVFPNNWSLAAFDDGELTAWLRVIPMAMRINGHGLSFGAVGPVVSMPQHRRKGHVGALLRQALSDMRDRGQALSGLHTPHPALYRRYGWEIASEARVYAFAPKDIELKQQPSQRGRARMLLPDDWAQADRVYRQHSANRNGPLHRGEVWWREAIFGGGDTPSQADIALWEDDSGEPQGYVVYHQKRGYDEFMPPFWIRELVALTSDAYLNLLLYILRHDLPREIKMNAAPYDPLLSVVSDTQRVKVEQEYDVMLRIVDAEATLQQRALAHPERELSFTLGVRDAAAPWNDATYQIEVNDGRTNIERTSVKEDLSVSAATLAPLLNGYLSVAGAVLSGLMDVENRNALGVAQSYFATLYPPFCSDGF